MTKELFKAACLTYLGLPYIWGGDDTILGFDCSGLTQDILAMLGLDPAGDQNAQALHDYFKTHARVGVIPDCGSLAFYGASLTHITHVAVLLDPKTIIEAGGGGSKTTDSKAAAAQNAYIRLRPLAKRKDLVAVITPDGLPWQGADELRIPIQKT